MRKKRDGEREGRGNHAKCNMSVCVRVHVCVCVCVAEEGLQQRGTGQRLEVVNKYKGQKRESIHKRNPRHWIGE